MPYILPESLFTNSQLLEEKKQAIQISLRAQTYFKIIVILLEHAVQVTHWVHPRHVHQPELSTRL